MSHVETENHKASEASLQESICTIGKGTLGIFRKSDEVGKNSSRSTVKKRGPTWKRKAREHHISMLLQLEHNSEQVLLTGFYGSPVTAHRKESWKLLKFLKPREGLAWLCFGDFNETLHLHEKQAGAMRPYHQMEEFRSSLVLAAQSSDHSPLVMHLKKGGRRYVSNGSGKERIFRYEASWKLHEECNEGNTGTNNGIIKEVQLEIDKLLEEENVKWKQRAKQAWLKDGDSNSKFFHRCANQRRKTNEINCLVREDGSLTRDLEEISECFGNYYQSLFSSSNPVGIGGCIARLDKKVDGNMNTLLDAEFSVSDVKEALFQMKPLGSPGPDGFPAEFYQAHSNIVGEKVTQAVLEVLNSGGDISVAFETMHSMSIRGGRQQSHMVIKLDMSKAYDRIEWGFLHAVMVKLGFSEKWIRLVMGCVSSVSYSLLINGSSQGFFKPSRGIRQGDPLSPYLFLLVSEVLSNLLNHAERNKRIHGFPVGKGQININHLLFTDDCLLFCRVKAEEWATINSLLSIYEGASGQKINKEKTSIYFNANTRPEAKDYILGIASTRATTCYERYLGLPSLVGRSRYKSFKSILDRVRSRVSNWKTKLLSQAGKEILLKPIIQALPTYSMGVFKLPKVILKEINKVMNQFWWGQQDKGNKQAWRIIQFPASLASQVLKAKYFRNSSFLHAKLGARPSLIWRSIWSSRDLIEKGSMLRIGNGKETKIWKDRWLPQPSSFMVQRHGQDIVEEALVAELINEETKQWDREKILRLLRPTNAVIIQKIHVPNAVKVFLWRSCLESLPTMLNLFKKKIVSSRLCPVCCSSDETAGHILWNCPSAMDVWSYGPKRLQKRSVRAESFVKIIKGLKDQCDIQMLGAFALTARDIW
ncbi:uncharacterized protein LOC122316195 [Carya illinoinensis]|uniref:uncharacterized protein LOC122316195 n=1 Tax=Carya illinoinensis TaxID=32201 RepID=UPI001C7278DA|nr:uncharacterized protein LOC122316195 [Carya illinoinensis]